MARGVVDEGNTHATNFEHYAVLRWRPDGQWKTVARDPRPLWPDTVSVAADGYLYVTANLLRRQLSYQGGEDRRQKPYALFRGRIGAGFVDPKRAARMFEGPQGLESCNGADPTDGGGDAHGDAHRNQPGGRR